MAAFQRLAGEPVDRCASHSLKVSPSHSASAHRPRCRSIKYLRCTRRSQSRSVHVLVRPHSQADRPLLWTVIFDRFAVRYTGENTKSSSCLVTGCERHRNRRRDTFPHSMAFVSLPSSSSRMLNCELTVQRAIIYDVRIKPRTISTTTGSKDLQMVTLSLRVLSRPDVAKLAEVYRKLGQDYDERVLPSIGNEVLKATVANYDAAELIVRLSFRISIEEILMGMTYRRKEKWYHRESEKICCEERGSSISSLKMSRSRI